jgi:hypothetical protein
MAEAPSIPTTESVVLRAARRSLTKVAPCHLTKNSIADAVILEAHIDAMAADTDPENQFVFLTTNYTDYSEHNGNRNMPHPELAPHFQEPRSIYSIQVAEIIKQIDSDMLEEFTLEGDYHSEPRRLSEILEAEETLFRQVWYNRHWGLRNGVESGEITIITKAEFSKLKGYHPEVVVDEIYKGAVAAAKKTEDEVGLENLGPWTDFEWGMVNGKLSALRWVTGDDWDMLDT